MRGEPSRRNADAPSPLQSGKVVRLFAIALPALVLPFLIRAFVIEGIATATEVSTVALVYVILAGFDLSPVRPKVSLSGNGEVRLAVGSDPPHHRHSHGDGVGAHAVRLLVRSRRSDAISAGRSNGLSRERRSLSLLCWGACSKKSRPSFCLAPCCFRSAESLHVDLVHYAMVAVLAMGIGLFCPPFGVGYYAACAIGQVHPSLALGHIWPYMGALLVGLGDCRCLSLVFDGVSVVRPGLALAAPKGTRRC